MPTKFILFLFLFYGLICNAQEDNVLKVLSWIGTYEAKPEFPDFKVRYKQKTRWVKIEMIGERLLLTRSATEIDQSDTKRERFEYRIFMTIKDILITENTLKYTGIGTMDHYEESHYNALIEINLNKVQQGENTILRFFNKMKVKDGEGLKISEYDQGAFLLTYQ